MGSINRIWGSAFLLGFLAFAATEAAAQDTAPAPPQSPRLERLCHPAGSFDHRFGDVGVRGSSRLENSLGAGPELPAEAAPFTRTSALATPWSERLAQVGYELDADSDEQAEYFLLLMEQAAKEVGWKPAADLQDPGKVPIYLMAAAGDRTFVLPGIDGVLASFSRLGRTIMVTCAHKGLLRENAEEALGKLPVGTPRPDAPPPLAVPDGHTAADCGRVDVQREMLTLLDGRANEPLARVLRRANQAERLTQWKQWKLQSSGKVDSERLLALTVKAAESGSPGGDILAAFSIFPEMLAAMERLAAEADAGQREAACRSAFKFVGILQEAEKITTRQWAALNTALDAEARRVGVKLE